MFRGSKYKRGSAGYVMVLCLAIMTASAILLGIVSESYSRERVIINTFNKSLINTSIVEIAGNSLIEVIDQREGREGTYVFVQEDLTSIQSSIRSLTGETVEINLTNKLIENATTVEINLSCGYIVSLDNITLDTWQVEEIKGYDEDGAPIIEYINFYRINTDTANIGIKLGE